MKTTLLTIALAVASFAAQTPAQAPKNTQATPAVKPAARGECCCAVMITSNWEPSCSRLTRLATDVLLLKKVSQLVVIAAVDPAGAEAELVEAGDVVAGAGAEGLGDDGGVELEPLGLLFPQAAAAAVSATSANALTRRVICR